MMVADAAALVAEPTGPGAVELHLGRRVRPVAELVLEPLQPERVAACRPAAPAAPRSRSARPGACASTRNTSHIGAEQNHLWPVSSVLAVGAERLGAGRVGPDVGAALLLGHAHAGEQPGLAGRRAAAPGRTTVAVSPGSQSAATAGSVRRAGTAAYVIDTGQPWPASTCDQTTKPAARRDVGRRRRPTRRRRADPRRRRRPSARARTGGSRPRRPGGRSGRGSAAPAGARWPRRPSAAPPRSRPGGRARTGPSTCARPGVPADRLDQRPVAAEDVVADQRRRLVGHLVGRGRPLMWPTVEAWPRGPSASSRPVPTRAGRRWRRRPSTSLWRLTKETTAICFRYRVTGLAAEAGFFALLSLPPLVLGLVGSIGYVGKLDRRGRRRRGAATGILDGSPRHLHLRRRHRRHREDAARRPRAATGSTWCRSAS